MSIFQENEIVGQYLRFRTEFPKSRCVKINLLKASSGPIFEKQIHKHLKESIQKGQISSLKELDFVYSNKDKTRIVQNTLIKMLSTLKFFNSFDEDKKIKEPPSTFVWCHFFLATHLDKMGKHEKALDIIETVIKTDQDDIDLLLLKAKILKHKGELERAVEVINTAQKLDPTDKDLACKCGKYLIRAGHINEGVELIKSFDPKNDQENDSPCHWLLLELAKAYLKQGDLRSCIKKCIELRQSFESIWEDQLDFHVFGLTRMRLCHYVEMLRFEDTLYQDKHYQEAAEIAIDVLLKLNDGETTEVKDKNNNLVVNGSKKKGKGKKKNVSTELKQNEAYEDIVKDPLKEAAKFLKPLEEAASDKLSTHMLSFEISLRRKRPLKMLQAVTRLQTIDKSCPKVVETVTRFYDYISKHRSSLSEPVITVIKQINV